jgi:energy-coupling factor transport system ATP-binding protein
MGLLDARQFHPLALPRGDRARVVIAAVLAMDPDVIVLDEPTTGQDDRGARAILDVTQRLHRAGKTIIVVTHHLHLMPEVAERMLVLTGGRVTLDAPLRQAYHSLDALRASFLEPPQAVHLARRLAEVTGRDLPLVTPAEVADCLMGSAVTEGGP